MSAIVIEQVQPELDAGRFAVKREVGDVLEVWADIFAEGHDILAAALRYRRKNDPNWQETPMRLVDNDRWHGSVRLEHNTRYQYTIEAYRDVFATWRRGVLRKHEVGEDVTSEILEGLRLLAEARAGAEGEDADVLDDAIRAVSGGVLSEPAATQPEDAGGHKARPYDGYEARGARPRIDQDEAVRRLTAEALAELMVRYPDRRDASRYERVLEVIVDRVAARHAAWYEMFPRSAATSTGGGATLREAEEELPRIQAMGFNVLYLPPIHPIGNSFRKGRNNTLTAGPDDPGSPWAIGNEHGGHKAVNPQLGTLDDFDHFVAAANACGLEVALDYAINCSPDHPYVREHPDWFYKRPDGTIRYAENPPKKYQDIYPINFFCDDRQALWDELKSILLFWIEHGVTTFRVDNPHTKPFPFWEWAIGEVQAAHPEVVFLSEAFTRPKVMKYLAKAGFSQSYTYFTWRNFKAELIDYLTELTQSDVKEYMRGNFFANTPDILPEILQKGGQPAFKSRLVLAATLSSVYGIYSGYELCENEAIPGGEEYFNSEKYEIKQRNWDQPGNLVDYVAAVNRIRRLNPALHEYDNLRFYPASDDNVLFYGKRTADNSNAVLVAVNLDPFQAHRSTIQVPLHDLGIGVDETYEVQELLAGSRYFWKGETQSISLDPLVEPAAIFVVRRWQQKSYQDPCS